MPDEIVVKKAVAGIAGAGHIAGQHGIVVCNLSCGLSVANVYYAQPLLDALARDFGFSAATIGIVITMTQAGCALALLLLVPLGDLLERRRLMLVQLVLLIVALLATATASTSFWLLTACWRWACWVPR